MFKTVMSFFTRGKSEGKCEHDWEYVKDALSKNDREIWEKMPDPFEPGLFSINDLKDRVCLKCGRVEQRFTLAVRKAIRERAMQIRQEEIRQATAKRILKEKGKI